MDKDVLAQWQEKLLQGRQFQVLTIESIDVEGGLEAIELDKVKLKTFEEVGQLMPVTVTEKEDGRYQLVHGRRTLRALSEWGSPFVLAMVAPSDFETDTAILAENLGRSRNKAVEVDALEELMLERGYGIDDAKNALGVHKRELTTLGKLTRLSECARTQFRAGKLSATTALVISDLPVTEQDQFLKDHEKWTLKAARAYRLLKTFKMDQMHFLGQALPDLMGSD